MASQRMRELSLNTALFAVSTFGSKLVSFLLLPLYTSVLSTADYGSVDLVTSTVSLLIPVLTLNIQDAVLRFGLGHDAGPEEVLSVGLRTQAGGACVLLVALSVLAGLNVLAMDGTYLVYLFAMFFLGALNNVLTMHLKSLGHIRVLVVSGVGSTLVTCVLAILLLVVLRVGVAGYMAAMAAGSLFAVLTLLVAERVPRSLMTRPRPGLFLEMIAYSAPLIANSVAWWVNDVSDRYVVTLVCGAAANGVYAVAFKVPSILSTLQSIFYSAWSISAIKEFDKFDTDGFLGRMYGMYSTAMSLSCSAIMLFDVPLADILYSNEFFEAWRYVPFLLVGVFLNGLALFQGCIFSAARRTREVSITTLAGATASLVSCIALTILIGPIGAAIATMIGYLVTWVVRTRVMLKRVARIRVAWRTEIACLAILFIQAVVASLPRTQPIQVIALLALILLQRGRILDVLKRFPR